MNRPVFFCDHCSKYDDNNRQFYNTFDKTKYNKHLTTSKHLENVEKHKDYEPCFECKYCKEIFDSKGYEEHKRKNQQLWDSKNGLKITYGADLYKNRFSDLSCNNFVVDKKRYSSFEEMVEKGNVRILPYAKPKKVCIKTKKINMRSNNGVINSDEDEDEDVLDNKYKKLIFMTYCNECCLMVNDINAKED